MTLKRTLLILVAGLAGCVPAAKTAEHKFKIDAPAKVKKEEIYVFKVNILNAAGETVDRVSYTWMIDWPEAKGMLHNGLSGQPQQMKVKGGGGKALLRLYADDSTGRRVQVEKFEFLVE